MTHLSLSVRIAEEFHSKEKASMTLEALADLAVAAGYRALCMRASQVGVQSSPEAVANAAGTLATRGLSVSMVTGDFAIVYNNDQGPDCLRRIGPYLDLAAALRAPLIRVALKKEEDISWAQRAADEAAARGLKLVHQCHTQSLFETVDGIERTLRQIGRPNFGLIYEPANLELCGQEYGPKTIERLAPWIFNVYLQNQVLKPDGKTTLKTWCRGPVPLDLIPIHAPGGIDFGLVFRGLAEIKYRGPVTVHQAGGAGESPREAAKATADFLEQLEAATRLEDRPRAQP
ncbi:MAG: sugar phosphate isomerase/epimerase [Verrucomicrobia bacterium]|nr:sugar phosphate isomerase/epimerase [Verrucomicrobiota bacterium]